MVENHSLLVFDSLIFSILMSMHLFQFLQFGIGFLLFLYIKNVFKFPD